MDGQASDIAIGLMITYDSPKLLVLNKVLIGTTVILLLLAAQVDVALAACLRGEHQWTIAAEEGRVPQQGRVGAVLGELPETIV